MFLTAKLNLVLGMVIGVTAVMLTKQVCKRRNKNQQTPAHVASPQDQSGG